MEEYYLVADYIVKIKIEEKEDYCIYMDNNVKRVKKFDGRDGLKIIEKTKKKILEQYEHGHLIYRGVLF